MALREGETLYYFLSDHLGSTSLTTDSAGNKLSELRYTPWGESRASGYTERDTPTDYRFTGQREEAEVGLYFYQARWYDAQLGRFLQADTVIPNPLDPLSYDRYAYSNNNPLYYTDPSGHIPIPVILVIAAVVLKAIDYGWTAYDAYQSNLVLADPNATASARALASANLAMTVGFEAAEPDDALPISLPIDDVARLMAKEGMEEAIEETTESAASGFIRAVPVDQVGTSQPFKIRPGEDGLSVFEGVQPADVLAELPGNRVPNTTVIIPSNGLPPGTQVISTAAPGLSQKLSDAHRILVKPTGWSTDRFAKAIKGLVGWE